MSSLLLLAEWRFFCADPRGTKGEAQAGCRGHAEEPSAGDAGGLLLQHRGRQPHRGTRHLREVVSQSGFHQHFSPLVHIKNERKTLNLHNSSGAYKCSLQLG